MALGSTMMDAVAVLQSPTTNRDTAGGETQDPFVTVASNIPCSYQEPQANISILYGQRNTVTEPTVWFISDPNIDVDQRLVITVTRTQEVIYCIVIGEAQPVARGRVYRVSVKRVRGPK